MLTITHMSCGMPQFVEYNNMLSNTHGVSCGISQGSVLGTLLVLIYMNAFRRNLKANDSNSSCIEHHIVPIFHQARSPNAELLD